MKDMTGFNAEPLISTTKTIQVTKGVARMNLRVPFNSFLSELTPGMNSLTGYPSDWQIN